MISDALRALVLRMPSPGSVWPLKDRVLFFQALDAVLAMDYGGETLMIWLGEDGEIHIAERTFSAQSTDKQKATG